ncbi:MAG: hypothetical protein A2534_00845 [Candidatus Magasanikbacteria bacterium RIFOXYD2_FULL_39_9]|uniref:Uncharacterized protein n=1 Tax=Candidatus Magasanikbacteria bacterium RIFOXYD1_FULL_40_23 TaxID=1798705 RepID=A0A1F6PBF7_9BACT|nr:MAG: hypothetical protein A2534_00845 [Candidatus Magasanikbacteria bacterium RIFOXYD2_FULL_39_9]OGH93390.1 MAG: hypothetical protein A2563_02155 [Candidatus Magasanikbacteria bacterium RIFOXYD1_FULL_40_23]
MYTTDSASLFTRMKVPIAVLVKTHANMFIRELRLCQGPSIADSVTASIAAEKLRRKPVEALAELITHLEKPQPRDDWSKIEYGLILLITDLVRMMGVSIPKDIWEMDRKQLLERFKWVHTWSAPVK